PERRRKAVTTTNQPEVQYVDGRAGSVAGPVVDVEFPSDAMAEINAQLTMSIELDGEDIEVAAEVAQQIGDNRVRAICMKPTDGLRRGQAVTNTGAAITVPVGDVVLGHVFNVLGDPLDVPAAEPGEIETL